MMMRGRLASWLGMAVLSALLLAGPAMAETITQTFEHQLGIGESAKSFEHRIDLPEPLAMKGQIFVGRQLELSGKMVIEREELKGTYYYVKVRLPKATLWVAKGSLKVTLETGAQPPATPVLESCTGLKVTGPGLTPRLSWNGAGKYTAVTLLDRGSGKTVWERVILGKTVADLDEGGLSVGRRYFFGARQSDETARYSPEAKVAFRVDVKVERCRSCYGTGWETCRSCNGSGHFVSQGPNGQPIYTVCSFCHGTGRQPCTWCNGTGKIETPIIVPE